MLLSSPSRGSLDVKGASVNRLRFVEDRFFRRVACWLKASSIAGRGRGAWVFNNAKISNVMGWKNIFIAR